MMRGISVLVLVVAALVPAATALERATGAAPVAPQLSVTNVTVLEGNSGTRTMNFDVTLSAPATAAVSVNYTTADDWQHLRIGTAFGTISKWSPADYGTVSGTLTFAAGVTEKVVPVPVFGDTTVEPDEHFTLILSNPKGATLEDAYGSGTILNDDGTRSGAAAVGVGDVSVRQPATGARVIDVPVTFSTPTTATTTITYATHGGTAVAASNAHSRGDYVRASGARTVPSGVTSMSLPITILADAANARSRTFGLSIKASIGAVARAAATVTVRSDSIGGPARARHGGPPRIALVGDSVTADYTDTAKPALEALGYAVENHGVAGTGITDADECTGAQAAALRDTEDPDIVIFENVGDYGNDHPHCHASVAYDTPQFFTDWHNAAATIASILTAHGERLDWLLEPQTKPGARHDVITHINPITSKLAASTHGMSTIDAFTPFGGDPPDCSLRDSFCLHLSPSGRALMTKLVVAAVPH